MGIAPLHQSNQDCLQALTGIHRSNRLMAALIGLVATALLFCVIRPDLAMTPV